MWQLPELFGMLVLLSRGTVSQKLALLAACISDPYTGPRLLGHRSFFLMQQKLRLVFPARQRFLTVFLFLAALQ